MTHAWRHWSLTRPLWNALHAAQHSLVRAEKVAENAWHRAVAMVWHPKPVKKNRAPRRAAVHSSDPYVPVHDPTAPEPLGSHPEVGSSEI